MRSNETLPLILLSLAFASHGCGFSKRKMHTHRKNDGDKCTCATPTRYNSPADSNRTVDPHCECDSSGFGVVRKRPYNGLESSGAIHVDLTSACVRCTMCTAIADEINETLFEIHDAMGPDDLLTDTQAVFLLRNICDLSFRHYGLREIDGERFISDPLPGDRLVLSSADGLWEKSLRNMCHEYLDEIQEPQLYRKWLEWCEEDEYLPDLEDILCSITEYVAVVSVICHRNEVSTLRDCRGMASVHKRHMPSKDYSVHMKILAECHKCG